MNIENAIEFINEELDYRKMVLRMWSKSKDNNYASDELVVIENLSNVKECLISYKNYLEETEDDLK